MRVLNEKQHYIELVNTVVSAEAIRSIKQRLDEAMKVDESLALVGAGVGGVIALCAAALKMVAKGEELRAIAIEHGPKLKKLFSVWQEKMKDGKWGKAAWSETMLWRDPAEIAIAKKEGRDWRTVKPVYEQLPPKLRASVMAVIDDHGVKQKKKETPKSFNHRIMNKARKNASSKDFVKRSTTKAIKMNPSDEQMGKERYIRHNDLQFQE